MRATLLIINLLFMMISSPAICQSFDPDGLEDDLDIHPTDVVKFEAVGADILNTDVTVGLRLTTLKGFSIYTKNVKFAPPSGFSIQNIQAPPTKEIIDPIGGDKVTVYSGGEFIIKLIGLEPYNKPTFPLEVTFLGCTERICLFPYKQLLEIPTHINVKPTTLDTKPKLDEFKAPPTEDEEQELAKGVEEGKFSLGALMGILFLAGLFTNLTPCVFPMIPITLRILGNQGASPWLRSTQYSLGIITTYTLLGFLASLSGGLFGSLMGSTTVNSVFAVLFVGLALTMLGFGNLSKLQNLGSRLGSGKQSGFNTFLMGSGAGLVAAPCTGPILAALIIATAKDAQPAKAFLQFLVYSTGFGLPYIFLGGAAGKISRLKVPSSIQVGVKLVFAAVMFALTFYYLRIPLRELMAAVDGFWKAGGIVTGFLGAAAVIGVGINAPNNKSAAIIPTIILGFSLFAGSQWLSGGDIPKDHKLNWIMSIEEGIKQAQANNKPIIIDGWAEWCEACKKMDRTTYLDPELKQELVNHWTIVKLDFTEIDEAAEVLAEKYKMQGLPVTVLLEPEGEMDDKAVRLTGYLSAKRLLRELKSYRAGR